MTLQVAMIAANGWVLASDRCGTIQGGNWKRHTYDTEKIIYRNGIVSAVYGDECAIIARGKIFEKIDLKPDDLHEAAIQQEMENIAVGIFKSDEKTFPGIPASRSVRGVVFIGVRTKTIWTLAFGESALFRPSSTRSFSGDEANPVAFLSERYYDQQRPVTHLAFLAAHTVLQGAKFNHGVGGLDLWMWQDGWSDAKPQDSAQYIKRSKALDAKFSKAMQTAMANG